MLEIIKSQIVPWIGTRLGTFATGALVGLGINAIHADWIGTGIAGVFFVLSDFGLAWMRERSIKKKAVANAGVVG